MRDPPTDWFIANYFDWKVPDEAGRRQADKGDARWQRALENTMRIGQMLSLGESEPKVD